MAETHPSCVPCWRKNHCCHLTVSGAGWKTCPHRSCGTQRRGKEKTAEGNNQETGLVCLSVCRSPCLPASGRQDYLCLSASLEASSFIPNYLLVSLVSSFSAVSLDANIFILLLADFSPQKRPWLKVYRRFPSMTLLHFHILFTGFQMQSVFLLLNCEHTCLAIVLVLIRKQSAAKHVVFVPHV